MLGKDLEMYLAEEVKKIMEEETIVRYEFIGESMKAFNKKGEVVWSM